jgi:beta-galactosidase
MMNSPLFGVDYYPEHWERTRWSIDARLMQQAGINTVRLAEFAWSRLEPREGCFDFAWLDEAIDILMAHDMKIILGTPTAAPPAWLIQAHPEILPINESGQQAGFGMRRHYCPTQPSFLSATRRIVEAMAAQYQNHPAVFAWQIDNELGDLANGIRCHCASCRSAFQHWLKLRYTNLEQLNSSWGTVFWSQEYTAWEQIPVPLRNVRAHNPALLLDFARFTSEMWVRYQQFQVHILREKCPQHQLTHNCMGLFPYVDYTALARDLDVVAWDNYPRLPAVWSPFGGNWNPAHVAMTHDVMRGLKKRPFWVMEQQAGPTGWGTLSPTPLPGEIRLWSLQSIARGAEAILYFRWRTARVGTEQHWHGILPHHGRPGRRYEEVCQTGEAFQRLREVIPASLPTTIALVRSYETLWAFEGQPIAEDFSYDDQIARYYRALWQRNLAVDLITEDQSWESYRLIIVPCLLLLREDIAVRLQRWVKAGGTLVVTFRSAVKNASNQMVDAPLPAALCDLTGVQVADYTTLPPAGTAMPTESVPRLELNIDESVHVVDSTIWMDELVVDDAEVLARYSGGPFDGAAAITLKHSGAGNVFYVGTSLTAAGQDLLMRKILAEAGISSGIPSPENVEIIRRVQDGHDYWFILNHNATPCKVQLPASGTDLITNTSLSGQITINGFDVLVIDSRSHAASEEESIIL